MMASSGVPFVLSSAILDAGGIKLDPNVVRKLLLEHRMLRPNLLPMFFCIIYAATLPQVTSPKTNHSRMLAAVKANASWFTVAASSLLQLCDRARHKAQVMVIVRQR